jgi:hypothetical protein
MMTHRDPLPGLREWISPRGYASQGDDAPPYRGLCSRDVMQGGSKRITEPKGRCDESPLAGSEGGLIGDPHEAAPAVVDGERPDRR